MEHTTFMSRDLRQEFAELFEQHRRMVLKVVSMYARGVADREDLAQEIAAQLWRAFPSYDMTRSFSTWLYRIALNVAISHARRNARECSTIQLELEHEVPTSQPEEPADGDGQVLLDAFMAELDPLNRALLLLYLEDRSYRQISDILGISATNVSTKINRLKERVKRFGEVHGTR